MSLLLDSWQLQVQLLDAMENALVVFCFQQLHLNEKITLLTSMSVYLHRNEQSVS